MHYAILTINSTLTVLLY